MSNSQQEIEEKIQSFWEKNKINSFDLKRGPVFSIDTPPPTLSGKMHIGHAFSYAQQDFIARYQRMKSNVFYPFGTDDNGLPTERMVEKLKNVKSKDMSRSEFIALCMKTLKETRPPFIENWKRLGISCDYSLYYSTIDDATRKISQKSFIDLYNAQHVFKQDLPTFYCPECQTPVAQAELEDKEEGGMFTTIPFAVDDSEVLIATTRPELLDACVALSINPKDKRHKRFIGLRAKVPLYNYEVPIIADDSADMEKGTGVLMICSYGDKFDADFVHRLALVPSIIIEKDGTMKDPIFKGLSIKETRKKILEKLKEKDLIKNQEKIIHAVNVHDKCGTPIEFLPVEQWFIRVLDKKKQLIRQGKKIKWHPAYMQKRYENWVLGLEWDWSISRERHFGVPIPAWYCESCKKTVVASEKELPIDPMQVKKKCPDCNEIMKADERVLDTWATSSLTPQIAAALAKGITIPYSLRPQAHDIIRTWAFYTIVKSLYHKNTIPWKNIMISGFVTLGGEKMSKSKGNVIDPQKILTEMGADALRFWAAGSSLGEDLKYQEEDLLTGKKLITKLQNASRFVFMNLKEYKHTKPKKLEKIDVLFLQQLNKAVEECTHTFDIYEYSKAKRSIEHCFWKLFCDNYLEIVKTRIYTGTGDKKISAQYTLYHGLLTILKLLAPLMPFTTESLYQEYYKKKEKEKSIHLSKWPTTQKEKIEDDWNAFIEVLTKVRQEKTKRSASMRAEILLTLPQELYTKLRELLPDLKQVTNAKEIKQGTFEVHIS